MSGELGRVVGLWCYSVKSMAGEALDAAEIRPCSGPSPARTTHDARVYGTTVEPGRAAIDDRVILDSTG